MSPKIYVIGKRTCAALTRSGPNAKNLAAMIFETSSTTTNKVMNASRYLYRRSLSRNVTPLELQNGYLAIAGQLVAGGIRNIRRHLRAFHQRDSLHMPGK